MGKDNKQKDSNIYVQMGIFAAILFVSQLISDLFPKSFVVPTSLIAMVLLYILLAAHLDIMKKEGLQDVIVIIISTIILLVVIAYVGALVMGIHHKITGTKDED